MSIRSQLAVLLFLPLVLTSCCRKAVPVRSEKTDSVRVERVVEIIEKLRDTTIYVKVPLEAVQASVLQDSSHLETSLAESEAMINSDGSLFHTLKNKRQEIPVKAIVRDTEERTVEIKEAARIEYKEVPVERELTRTQNFLIWSGVTLWALLVLYAFFRIKNWFKIS